MSTLFRFAALVALAVVGAAGPARADDEEIDPPGRVARLSYVRGDVSFSPAGENDWVDATLNRPLINGDRLWTDRGARAELQLGGSAARLDDGTSLQLLNMDDRTVQMEVTQGTLNLKVRRLYQDQVFEVDTPTLAFTVTRPGEYRIDVDNEGKHTTVAVWDGGGVAYGENANFPVREGEAIRFFDPELRDYEVFDIPRPDEFDRFCQMRDDRLENATALRYVPDDMVGYSDLDDNGSWDEVAEYGAVWYPTHVAVDWAPYRYGHWIWQEPWGWTWVDDANWGFAPFHYGRWAYIGTRWGWVPGPIRVRPVYSPALVGFVGGAHWTVSVGGPAPIGWFPLGPREVYCPPYHVSRGYFTRVNITNTVINTTYINTVYADYHGGRGLNSVNYAYRSNPRALSAVPGNVFAGARPVNGALIRLDREAAARAEITRVAAIAPVQRSVIGAGNAARAVPQRAALDRNVVARSAPPPTIAPFAAREQALRRDPGRPLENSAAIYANRAAAVPRGESAPAPVPRERVQVVGGDNPVNARTAATGRNGRGAADNARTGAPRNEPILRTPPADAGSAARSEPVERGNPADTARGPRAGDTARPPSRSDALPSRSYRNGNAERGAPSIAPGEPNGRAPVEQANPRGNERSDERIDRRGRAAQPVLRTAPAPTAPQPAVEPQRATRAPRDDAPAQRQIETRQAVPRQEIQRRDAPRVEPQRQEAPRQEQPRAAPRQEAPRVEMRRAEPPPQRAPEPRAAPPQRQQPAPRNDNSGSRGEGHEHGRKKDDN